MWRNTKTTLLLHSVDSFVDTVPGSRDQNPHPCVGVRASSFIMRQNDRTDLDDMGKFTSRRVEPKPSEREIRIHCLLAALMSKLFRHPKF